MAGITPPTDDVPHHGRGPLAHLSVLELAIGYAGPFAGRILQDFGARVVKIEDPRHGDSSRTWQPSVDGLGLGFARVNANKKSVAIDLRTGQGQQLVRDLAQRVDVVIENFRPGRMESWGLGYDALSAVNPGLIMVRVSGFGQVGPYRERPGFGTVADAFSGFAFVNGWPTTPPTIGPFGMTDSIAAMAAVVGALVAVVRRSQTGRGDEIDIALYEPLMVIMGDIIMRYSVLGQIEQRNGSHSGSTAPRGLFQTADGGWVAIAGSSQNIVERIFQAMGRPELIQDERFATNKARVRNRQEIESTVADWARSHDRIELLHILEEHEVAAGPVNDARDIVEDEHLRLRGSIVELVSQRLGRIAVPGMLARLRGYEGPTYGDPPELGEHTAEILQEQLSLGAADLEALQAAGVIGLGSRRDAARAAT